MRGGANAFKMVAVAALWLLIGRVLPDLLWRALPDVILDSLSLPAYSMVCQVVTTLVGLGAARLAFTHMGEALGAKMPSGWDLALAAMLAPAVFVAASFLAIKIAEPSLVAELAREGAGASRRNAGAFGRAVTEAPLLVTLVWAAVLAAVAEELAFRGALFGAIQQSALALFARNEALSERSGAKIVAGCLAVVLTAAAFGAMHADMKGSVGIVRVASATCLGLACGSVRLVTSGIFASTMLHCGYNCVSLGIGRGLFRGDSEPLISVVPNRLLTLAALGAFLAIAISVARRASRSEV
ncbi:MAG TPA: CPBP family glutamic-type intramembrane protease [Polyangiaceae bacterium]|nr:CPBP family glutamic-type intramembrane protease [Polyangiaceae bacterium]